MLSLPHARLHLAARVERHRHPAGDGTGLDLTDSLRWVEAAAVVGFQLHGWQQLAADGLDIEARSLLAVQRRHHARALAGGNLRGLRQRLRHQVARTRLHKPARRMADDALVSGAAGL